MNDLYIPSYVTSVSFKKSNLLICFCSFYLSCPILEKTDNFIENVYIVLSNGPVTLLRMRET